MRRRQHAHGAPQPAGWVRAGPSGKASKEVRAALDAAKPIVLDVAFRGWTPAGELRHALFNPRQTDLFAPKLRDQDAEARDFLQRLITGMKAHGISLRKGEELWGVDHNTLAKIVNGTTEPKLSVYFRMKRWLRRPREASGRRSGPHRSG